MAEIRIDGVHKRYPNGAHAVRGVDVAIEEGEFVVLLGPSGCGKSTLLRMVAGLEEVTEGEIAIADRVVNDVSPADRDIAMVFQNYALYPHMSVYKNMAYGLMNRGFPKEEIREKVRKAAELLQLEEYLERRPHQLSGGQRQRVAMGRAIVREPKAFLFDEPLSNLDAKLRVHMRVEIKQLQRRLGVTSLYVTHDQVEAMTLADRLIVMNGGVAEQIGPPLAVYGRPASTFVATFIGSPAMTLMQGRVESGAVTLDGGEGRAAPGAIDLPDGAVTVGVRPEDLRVADDGWIFGDVELAEHLGADQVLHVALKGQDQRLTARFAGACDVPSRGPIRLSAPAEALHLFDPQTGRRLGS
ncbi:MAG: sn-glycerol-3-phosphate ABC transporter ATP-binding protein UgpC [Marivibrio sp.]|uniref:sn-glycerol-3-phosphate ABC transporter ATP-binding protein UgpC n=1 Tax=Marivibrio sp. TaxID=2039719 RepID=UPI0032F05850